MGRLFKNEWIKIKYSRFLRVLYGVALLYALLMGAAPQGTLKWVDYGVTASFGYLRACGTMIMMFLSPLAGIFFTRELQQGTIHNTLSCGVGRGRYFAVKTVCILAAGLLLYIGPVLLFTLARSLAAGFWPAEGVCPPCGPGVAAAYQAGCLVQTVTYLMFFILLSILTKRTAVVNLAGIAVWFGEAALSLSVPAFKGPTGALLAAFALWEEGKVLTLEFVKLYGQCAAMSVVFLALAGFIFRRKDIS